LPNSFPPFFAPPRLASRSLPAADIFIILILLAFLPSGLSSFSDTELLDHCFRCWERGGQEPKLGRDRWRM
jgi:hypothetical protein